MILLVIAAILAIFILWVLTSCATASKTGRMHMLCVGPDGEVFHGEGISGKTGEHMTSDWDFEACKVKAGETSQVYPKKPPKE